MRYEKQKFNWFFMTIGIICLIVGMVPIYLGGIPHFITHILVAMFFFLSGVCVGSQPAREPAQVKGMSYE
jgi:uncharacterized membrane protein HdeD (DUF308 family)